jgi:hypothetical protein
VDKKNYENKERKGPKIPNPNMPRDYNFLDPLGKPYPKDSDEVEHK